VRERVSSRGECEREKDREREFGRVSIRDGMRDSELAEGRLKE